MSPVAQTLAACALLSLSVDAAESKPNFVLFLTDDQDWALGGWSPMRKAKKVLSESGVTMTNWFIHTPVCCPSRAELLSGRYFHNVRVAEPKDRGCMHVDTDKVNPVSFGASLGKAGYTVAWFGKHMNQAPHDPPPGFDCDTCYWFANGGGSDGEPGGYLNATFADFKGGKPVDGAKGTYKGNTNGEYAGYTTSIIGNKSIEWVREVAGGPKPFVVVVAPKAPHVPSTPAPWYKEGTFIDALKAPRTPDYNASSEQLADFHELIANQPPITTEQEGVIDELFRNRWRCLLSVDDAIADMWSTLEELGVADNTYMFSTSDHGYNLGQHRLPSCKLNVYDHDVRIPMVIRGPGIPANTSLDRIGSNVDFMPTVLDLAGAPDPTLDGKSIAPFLRGENPPWRDHHFIEYYSLGNVTRTGHLVDDTTSNTYRALRFVDKDAGNKLYAEFTSLDNWNFEQKPLFVEVFDLDKDPHQLNNIADQTSAEQKAEWAKMLQAQWQCRGQDCT